MFAIGIVMFVIGFFGVRATAPVLPFEEWGKATTSFASIAIFGGGLMLVSLSIMAWKVLP